MTHEGQSPQFDAPRENFEGGLVHVDMPALGIPERGKVRDSWKINKGSRELRAMVTTDRLSAYDQVVAAVPGKGQVLNLLSQFWFDKTKDIIPNHMLAVPHPNVLIAKQAEAVLPVELVVRGYMAQSSTDTSIYRNYMGGRRTIYGIDFPEGLQANQEFPMGAIITPTTKADKGEHDEELTDEAAREIVDGKLGEGTWNKARHAAIALFERGRAISSESGLILVDTKYEMGIDEEGNLILIDELHTPDSSRYWLEETYEERMSEGKNPDSFDKEIARRWLADNGFRGNGPIPRIDRSVLDRMSEAYAIPYQMLTGTQLPPRSSTPIEDSIREATYSYLAAA